MDKIAEYLAESSLYQDYGMVQLVIVVLLALGMMAVSSWRHANA